MKTVIAIARMFASAALVAAPVVASAQAYPQK